MKHHPEKSFSSATILTLADAAEIIADLPKATQREKASHAEIVAALRQFADKVGRTTVDIEATPVEINALAEKINAPLANLTPGSLANLMSRVRKGLRLVDQSRLRKRNDVPLTVEWKSLLDKLDRSNRVKVRRFAGFCSSEGIEPHQVDQSVFGRFIERLSDVIAAQTVSAQARMTAKAWENARQAVPNWPKPTLIAPAPPERHYRVSLDGMPGSLRGDFEFWRKQVVEAPLHEQCAPSRPYRPATVEIYTQRFQQLVSILVRSGTPLAKIRSLSALLDEKAIDVFIEFHRRRSGKPTPPVLKCIFEALLSFSKYGPPSCRDYIKSIQRKLIAIDRHGELRAFEMTKANRVRVDRFNDPHIRKKLLNLPRAILEAADKVAEPGLREARQAMAAIMIQMQIVCPLRPKNLFSTDLNRHLRADGKKRLVFRYEREEVKNRQEIEFVTDDYVKAMLIQYQRRYRPILLKHYGAAEGASYLYPGTDRGRVSHHDGASLFRTTTKRHLGIQISPHQMRHIMAFFVFAARPGDYGLASKVLGHTDATTTRRYYAGAESAVVFGRYHDILRDNGAFKVGRHRRSNDVGRSGPYKPTKLVTPLKK